MCKRRKKKKKRDPYELEVAAWLKEQRERLRHIDASISYYEDAAQTAKRCAQLNREQHRLIVQQIRHGERDLEKYRKIKRKK